MADKDGRPEFYALSRDASESNRLNRQHFLHVTNVGFHLHPTIETSLPSDAKIAEVATGTGIWLEELAAKSPPTWTFTGLDISAEQFPKEQQSNSSRVEYRLLNILKPIPEELRGQFDAVHLRLLCGALLSPEDWVITARHLKDLLKAGGHLQWQEGDYPAMQISQTVAGASRHFSSRFRELWRESRELTGFCKDGYLEPFPEYLRSAGLADPKVDIFASDRVANTRALANDIQMEVYVSILKNAIRGKWAKPDWTFDMVEEVYRGVKEEYEELKVYVSWPMHIATARKPTAEAELLA